ncbi:Multidrug resistance protein MdtA precursor [Caballeronia udeis]|uniref:Multidrug resistance protein MdtA n=1 Tax=Caballeronia udeis TaxID=1232866 RepID=A0A158GUG1_9BURK|nr:efflux RND transporter periplasmic adaptor subunit [Caballeronia udeis]SAL35682.1 Multidrug resistance protein MdtA precursor [Caballeronia udeis]
MQNNRLSMHACIVLCLCFSVFSEASNALADDTAVVVTTALVQRAPIAQPVRAYGIVAASAANLTSINLPYVARITQLRVQTGQPVRRGDPLFVVQADPAAALAATQARSAATLADGELARTQSLFDKGLATASQLAGARKAAQDAREALASQAQSGITSGAKVVASPVDGVVLQVSAGQGDQVQAGAPIMQLAGADSGRPARGNVMLAVEPSQAVNIHAGDEVRLRGLSTSLSKVSMTGRVVLVGASIDPQSQLVDVGANVPLGNSAFIPGTRVAADIDTNRGMHWVVPRSAVLKDDHGDFVFQVMSGNKAHRVNVVTQIEDRDRYGIDGPLNGAQPVVVSGNYELTDGMTVRGAGGAPR